MRLALIGVSATLLNALAVQSAHLIERLARCQCNQPLILPIRGLTTQQPHDYAQDVWMRKLYRVKKQTRTLKVGLTIRGFLPPGGRSPCTVKPTFEAIVHSKKKNPLLPLISAPPSGFALYTLQLDLLKVRSEPIRADEGR